MGKIKVLMDPVQREAHLKQLLKLDGLDNVEEDPFMAYCHISLTSTPQELKKHVKARQETLINKVLVPSGLKAYDPATAPYSPDVGATNEPTIVYKVDASKIAGARFFTGHNILPSTGQGVEAEMAKNYNRIAVVLIDKNIGVSSMQPPRMIYVEYENFEEQAKGFVPLFEMLQEFEPGMGLNNGFPVLLGFEKRGGKIVDLEELAYREFPELQYHYNPETPVIKLRAENPELFYETRSLLQNNKAGVS